jgi:hypothetical protein
VRRRSSYWRVLSKMWVGAGREADGALDGCRRTGGREIRVQGHYVVAGFFALRLSGSNVRGTWADLSIAAELSCHRPPVHDDAGYGWSGGSAVAAP